MQALIALDMRMQASQGGFVGGDESLFVDHVPMVIFLSV